MLNNMCTVCGSNKTEIDERYGTIGLAEYECRVMCCCECGHSFTKSGRNVNIAQLYGEGQYEILDTRGTLFEKIVAFDDRTIIKQLSRLPVSQKTLLDFGCGKGQFIYRALEYGWKVQGIETGEKRAEFGKNEYRLNISTSEYTGGLVDGGPFGVITLMHVLEHLDNPKSVIRELVGSNLVPGGYLVIEVPQFDSLQSKIAGKWWMHLDPPFHISHFTRSSLQKLLRDLSFEPVKVGGLSVHLGLLGMVQSLMAVFGYRKMIISELKFRRTRRLLFSILLLLPLAIILESVAVAFNKGGVVRVFCQKARID